MDAGQMTVPNISWQDALQRLVDGNDRFVEYLPQHRRDRREDLVAGQQPYACILSCADSRVVPEFVFDVGLGELFVVRVAGNVANMGSVGSIEFAVSQLGVNLVVVLGHENCGAVCAALEGVELSPNINHLLGFIHESVVSGSEVADAVRDNSKRTAKELVDRSDIIRDRSKEPSFKIAPAYYHLSTGQVEYLT